MTETDLLVLLTVLGTSFLTCAVLVLTQRWHGSLSLDHDLSGVQKIHKRPVPRVGGIGIAAGLVAGAVTAHMVNHPYAMAWLSMLLCAVPAFAAGLLEDVTKRVSVRTRLAASFASALCAAWLLEASLTKLDTPGLDVLMAVTPLALVFTCFAVGGVTNAVNIIDGVNGLASGAVSVMLGGLSVIAMLEGDQLVALLCLAGTASLLGFMMLNYPFGKIFLGDGGAYLAGFWLAECAVLLLVRNPEVSTWAVLLACVYPVWETIFSMFRRHVIQGVASGAPDTSHFHHVVLRVFSGRCRDRKPGWPQHSLTSASIWALILVCQLIAISDYGNTSLMLTFTLMLCLAYTLAYAILSNAGKQLDVQDAAAGMDADLI